MQRNQGKVSVPNIIVLLLIVINAVVLQQGVVSDPEWHLLLYVTVPALLIYLLIYRKR
jgi:hypothetical protein